MSLNDFLEDISLKGGARFFCVKCFDNNPLRKTQYVKVSELREVLYLGVDFSNYYPNMYKWGKGEHSSRKWEYDIDNSNLSLRDIHENDKAMQEFMKRFFPEYAI